MAREESADSAVDDLSVSSDGTNTLEQLYATARMQTPCRVTDLPDFIRDMRSMLKNPELCDVTFLVGDSWQPVYGVRAILSARSKIFQRMLQITPNAKPETPTRSLLRRRLSFSRSENEINKTSHIVKMIRIEEFQADIFTALMEYVHTGYVELQPHLAVGLMAAGEQYGLMTLRQNCLQYLCEILSHQTVCYLLTLAEKYLQYKSVKAFTPKLLQYFEDNANQLLESEEFFQLSEAVLHLVFCRKMVNVSEMKKYEALREWCRRNVRDTEHWARFMAKMIQHVDLFLLPPNMIVNEIRRLRLVNDDVIVNVLAERASKN